MAEVKLTAAQQAVVENRGGALLVSAAAGSGKTKVLVDRLLSMILDPDNPRNIDDFLMITYTKAAASELRGKILAAMQEKLAEQPGNRHLQRQMTRIYLADISTVHAFCSELLREFAYRMDLPADFRVGEDLECQALRQRVMEQVIGEAYGAMEPEFQAFADTLGSGRDDRSLGEIVETIYDKAQSHRDPDGWLDACMGRFVREETADYSETVWGAVLLSRLQLFLRDAVSQMEAVCERLMQDPALEKSYLPTFRSNLEQLTALQACKSWAEVHAFGLPDFGRLKAVRKCDDPDTKELAQFIRKLCAEELKKQLRVFRVSSDDAFAETAQITPGIRGAIRLAKTFAVCYQREKRRRHLLDFSDLEHEALRLLYGRQGNCPTTIAGEVSLRYQEILVDEYQDSNEVQDAIFRAISKQEKNLFMVGDVKQSIYRFRLADPGIFLEKYKTFSPYNEAKPGEPRKILLSQNFRSRGEILQAVNDVFFRAMSERTGDLDYGEDEALHAGLTFTDVEYVPVELHCIDEDFQSEGDEKDPQKAEVEAAFAARRIAELLRAGTLISDKGVLRPARPEDIAILLRSPRTAAPYYIDALQAVGVPCFCETGDDILKTTELQVLTSLLEIIENPHQDIPLLAVLASPLFGFTASELAEIRGREHRKNYYEVLCASELPKAKCFCNTLERFRDTAETDGLSRLFDLLLTETNAMAVFGAMKGGAVRKNNVEALRNLIVSHAQTGGDLVSFVRTLRDLRETGMTAQGLESRGAVILTSIHKSKGLEYPIVLLSGLSKAFNLDDLRKPVLIHPDLGVASNVTDLNQKVRYPSVAKQALASVLRQEAVSEELRVLYVAMTRAKDLLIMTYCSDYLETKLRKLVNLRNGTSALYAAAHAACEGDWILLEALGRTEAGELHPVSGKPNDTAVSLSPWKICLHSGITLMKTLTEPVILEQEARTLTLPDAPALRQMLDYRYPYAAAGSTPSKVTATQLKGRGLDDEISEYAVRAAPRPIQFRKPAFLEKRMTASEAGTVVHLAMQFLRYENCGSEDGILDELSRLVQEEFLTEAQKNAVDPQKILRFFESPLGKRVLQAKKIKREFKFSVLMEADAFLPGTEGEKVLLQGVTDCCLIEEDGVAVLDFKTDRVRPGGEPQRAEYYRGQLEGYAAALSRIFGQPVKEKILYFFETDTAITL